MTIDVDKLDLAKCLTQMPLPFEVFKREVSTEDSIMGQAILLLHLLQDQLKKVSERFTLGGVNENSEEHALVESLSYRLTCNAKLQNGIISSKDYTCATLLDLLYKKIISYFIPFLEGDVLKSMRQIVEQSRELEEERLELRVPLHSSGVLPSTSREDSLVSQHSTPATRTPATTASEEMDPTSALASFQVAGLKSSAEMKTKEIEQMAAQIILLRMFQKYLEDPKEVYMAQNPLVYWYGKMHQWPELSRLLIKYLAVSNCSQSVC
ncbi:zinc finger BED domain-containing protein 6-like [Pleurodeles waltl]|uniref:zinc finger BED domain-containing protein 6-like n=1 Tax=Pleurodeles waltl TaxID=8319 RepID=UPI003709A51E